MTHEYGDLHRALDRHHAHEPAHPAPNLGFHWVIAALVIVTILTIQGTGILLPTNLRLYFELQKPNPDSPGSRHRENPFVWQETNRWSR